MYAHRGSARAPVCVRERERERERESLRLCIVGAILHCIFKRRFVCVCVVGAIVHYSFKSSTVRASTIAGHILT